MKNTRNRGVQSDLVRAGRKSPQCFGRLPVKSMGLFGRRKAKSSTEKAKKVSKWVEKAKASSIWGGHNADEIDGINTLGGVVAALALSFVFGLQYMVAPGSEQMIYADFRSMFCKSQEFRTLVIDVFKTEDIGKHSEEYFNFTKMVRPNIYFDIEQFLRTTMAERYPGNSESVSEHMSCISDKDVQTVVAFTSVEFPMEYAQAFMLQTGDLYRWSKSSEYIGSLAGSFIMASLLWSIILNLSLALAPVREDESGTALVAWLMVGGPTMCMNYIFLVVGLLLYFVTHGRLLVAMSAFVEQTLVNAVDISLFAILLPVFIIGGLLGIIATVWSSRNTPATATKDTPKVTDMMVPKASSNADDAIPLQIEEKIEKISDTKMDGSDNLKESRM